MNDITPKPRKYNVSTAQRYGMMFFSCILCYLIAAFIMAFILHNGINPTKMRIAMVMQDVIMFILPAVATAIVVARRPGDFLMITRRPRIAALLLVFMTLIVSVPAMNAVIVLNKSLVLPDSMHTIHQWMVNAEQSANESMELVIGNGTVGSLIVGLLLIGVMAGFSEELFFRGALQQVIKSTPVSGHIAVWLTAFIFSAVHMQFFGFLPRMLLGAFFGYLAWWSGSLWLAVAAHVFNNSVAFIAIWLKVRSAGSIDIDRTLTPALTVTDAPMILLSLFLTLAGIILLYRNFHNTAK